MEYFKQSVQNIRGRNLYESFGELQREKSVHLGEVCWYIRSQRYQSQAPEDRDSRLSSMDHHILH